MNRFFIAQAAPEAGPALPPLPHPEQFQIPDVVPGTPWWVYAVGVAVVCALISVVVWLLFRARSTVPAPSPRPWRVAMEALNALRERVGKEPPAESAHAVSEILRRYFMERYKVPAPYRTRRELFELEAPRLSERVTQYEPLAVLWDELSFAPLPVTTEEAGALVDKAIQHLKGDTP